MSPAEVHQPQHIDKVVHEKFTKSGLFGGVVFRVSHVLIPEYLKISQPERKNICYSDNPYCLECTSRPIDLILRTLLSLETHTLCTPPDEHLDVGYDLARSVDRQQALMNGIQ